MFGPRGTGKTTFAVGLARELGAEHGDDAPAWEMLLVDLRHVISLGAFSGALERALLEHPRLGRPARAAIAHWEAELAVNLGVVSARARRRAGPDDEIVALHARLRALGELCDRLVVVFDEFQRLHACPGGPLSVIRSALMSADRTGRVSLMLTGSLRGRLEMMLHDTREPIWDQTHDLDLPALDYEALLDYVSLKFEATGKPIADTAVEHLLALSASHPKRTQHLAWNVWQRAAGPIDRVDVQAAYDELAAELPAQRGIRPDDRHAAVGPRARRQRGACPVPARFGRVRRQRQGSAPLRARARRQHPQSTRATRFTRAGDPPRRRLDDRRPAARRLPAPQ